jgi:hypothetical protein
MYLHRRLFPVLFALAALTFAAISGLRAGNQGDEKAPDPKKATEKVEPKPVIPGGRDEDTAAAIQVPDEFAWQLFLALCRQGDPKNPGSLDPNKPTIKDYDDDKPVVWELWALSSGGRAGGGAPPKPNRSEVFLDRGAKPLPWGTWTRDDKRYLEKFRAQFVAGVQQATRESGHAPILPRLDPSLGADGGQEVRMNRAGYEHVIARTLYNIEGLEEKFTKREAVSFPRGAQEIKALWVPIEEKDKKRYHWRTLKSGEKTILLGLSGLHIITRDVPNWFWTDFEHVDTERNAELPSRDMTTVSLDPPGVRPETKGSKWENYRLRGTQTDFTDSQGRPTLLANTQIERGFQQTSSCVACHARATVGLRSARPNVPKWRVSSLPVFEQAVPVPGSPDPLLVGSIGTPKPELYTNDLSERRFVQTDFLWSLPFRALSTTDAPPDPK